MKTKEGANGLLQGIYIVLNWGLFSRKREILDICAKTLEIEEEDDPPLEKKQKMLAM